MSSLFKPDHPTECQDTGCRGALCLYGDKVHCESCGALQDKHPLHAEIEADKKARELKDRARDGVVVPLQLEMTHGDRILSLEKKMAVLEARLATLPSKRAN